MHTLKTKSKALRHSIDRVTNKYLDIKEIAKAIELIESYDLELQDLNIREYLSSLFILSDDIDKIVNHYNHYCVLKHPRLT
jgi:hypothetical protein